MLLASPPKLSRQQKLPTTPLPNVVDDSVVVRRMVSNVLSEDAALEVVGVAANGRIALAKIPQFNPDIIILDIEMPEMDGLETLAVIQQNYPNLAVIMFSSLTERGATITLDALTLGATDYVTKPVNMGSKEAALQNIRSQIIPKIKAIYQGKKARRQLETDRAISSKATLIPPVATISRDSSQRVEIVAVGVSTGGPSALTTLLSAFPANFPVPVVIVQHMPPLFTKRLAERLTQNSQIKVNEGFSGAILAPGQAWIAPGDFHMIVERKGTRVEIRINQDTPENFCRPAVDVLFRSVVKTYGAGTLGIVLTGMGQDGLQGCECIRKAGGQILVQDKATSVVWGMPGMVANAGLADRVLPLHLLAGEIISLV
ncbi:MAG: chemotaxis response regulator protein-glutamate methylesterase [Symploca sp. SIO2E9]|nr:chemotaxis response regulator protein-glutamate methylesterase [Symploca sp. SIO2E9]